MCSTDSFLRVAPQLLNAATALLAALIGAGGALLLGYKNFSWNHSREVSSLRAAFRGEVTAILAMKDLRKYEDTLKGMSEAMRLNLLPLVNFNIFKGLDTVMRQDYFLIYKGSIQKLGLLPEAAQEITMFYTVCFAFMDDMHTFNVLLSGGAPPAGLEVFWRGAAQSLAASALANVGKVEELGKQLLERLR